MCEYIFVGKEGKEEMSGDYWENKGGFIGLFSFVA